MVPFIEQTSPLPTFLCFKSPPPSVVSLHVALQLLPHLEEERSVLLILRLTPPHNYHHQRQHHLRALLFFHINGEGAL